MNSIENRSSILPQANYFGRSPDPNKDIFDRRNIPSIDEAQIHNEV